MADLTGSINLLSRRLAEAAEDRSGLGLSREHAESIRQASVQVEKDLKQVVNNCGGYIGTGVVVLAATSVLVQAAEVLAAIGIFL